MTKNEHVDLLAADKHNFWRVLTDFTLNKNFISRYYLDKNVFVSLEFACSDTLVIRNMFSGASFVANPCSTCLND